MKAFLPYLLVSLLQSALAAAADRSAISDISPTPMVAASRALRVYLTETQTNVQKELSGYLAVVSLTEELIVVQWRKVHPKDIKSRDAVLTEVDHLEKRIDDLLLRVPAGVGKVERDRLKKLKTAIDVAIDDFRLRLKSAFFQ